MEGINMSDSTSIKTQPLLPHGEIIYRDVKFLYRVCICNRPSYAYLLKVSLISPVTGKIHKSKKKLSAYNRRHGKKEEGESPPKPSQKSSEYANAYKEGYLTTCDEKTVISKAKKIIPHLYADFQDEILGALRETGSDIHPRTAYEMMQREFFSSRPAVTEKTLRENRNIVKNFCDLLDHRTISELSDADIKSAVSATKGMKDKKLRLIEAFFEFCGENKLYSGQNPISIYLEHNKIKHTSSVKGLYPSNSITISKECEEKLHLIIDESITEDLSLAIPLVKGFKISIERLLSLTWSEVLIEDNNVRILDYLPNLTGGTHNYTRPPLRETADFLLKKRQLLLEKYSEKQINKMLVVPVPGQSISAKKATLSKYFRTTLLAAGVSQSDIQQAARPGETKSAGGAAYKLLSRHYDFVLQDRCEVDLDSGVGCYLRGIRIHDTTNDYYRSFSDPTGNHFLQVIMDRDTLFCEESSTNTEITEQLVNGHQEITIPAVSPRIRTAVLSKDFLFLPKGTRLIITSPCGIEGQVSFQTSPNTPPPEKHIDLY